MNSEALEVEVWGVYDRDTPLASRAAVKMAIDPSTALECLSRALADCKASGVAKDSVLKLVDNVF